MKARVRAIRPSILVALAAALVACSAPADEAPPEGGAAATDPFVPPELPGADVRPEGAVDPWAFGPRFGARVLASGDLEVRTRSARATRVELCLFRKSFGEPERLRLPMTRDASGVFSLVVKAGELTEKGITGAIFYGFRAYGPNWPYDPSFAPGSRTGFLSDVDDAGNRMNPNKLLVDPYALETSHDPYHPGHGDGRVYRTGEGAREVDSGPFAPKSVVVRAPRAAEPGLSRPLRDDVIYEVHVRGLTRSDPTVPENERGTYAGAARRAKYLKELGVTVIELLPIQETPNDQNERTPNARGDNYWGYSTLAYFAPDRRYAADKSPGGPTRELRAMVEAFHAEGIKVLVDVVYNHTSEGGGRGDALSLYSLRGLDNASYYALADDPRTYVDSNGVGANVNTKSPLAADLVVDSLRYWHDALGVDGFRFDLASVVANGCARGCYRFERDGGILARIAKELPARPDEGGDGADLVAEPWGLAAGSYQVGNFPKGWSEWNDRYRDAFRRDLNRLGVDAVPPRELARRLSGSGDAFDHGGRRPAASVNFIVAHDGMTLADLFAYDRKNNGQAWPFGPSDGGTDNDLAFSHGGDPARQRAVTRTAMALLALSAGVPMFNGGDERLRTQRGNNNAYNLDSEGTWLDWSPSAPRDAFEAFTRRALGFRHAHAALRPTRYWTWGGAGAEVRWLRDDGAPVNDAYLDDASRHYLGMLLDGQKLGDSAKAIFVAYNGWSETLFATVPEAPAGASWGLVADTSPSAEAWGNWVGDTEARPLTSSRHTLAPRSLAVFVAR